MLTSPSPAKTATSSVASPSTSPSKESSREALNRRSRPILLRRRRARPPPIPAAPGLLRPPRGQLLDPGEPAHLGEISFPLLPLCILASVRDAAGRPPRSCAVEHPRAAVHLSLRLRAHPRMRPSHRTPFHHAHRGAPPHRGRRRPHPRRRRGHSATGPDPGDRDANIFVMSCSPQGLGNNG